MSLIRKHTVSILLRLDEAQHRHLQKQVAASGLSTTQFLRDLIEGVEVKARLPNELPELLRQISAVGNNINQIARSVNAGIAKAEDAKRGLYLLDQVYELMYEVAKK